MSFLHSCFIENSSEAREWLESIGYENFIHMPDDNDTSQILSTGEDGYYYMYPTKQYFGMEIETDIDCRGNLELFKAISAMRDDSDYMQWYCFEQKGKKYKADPYFFLCEGENYIEWAKKQEPFTNTYVLAHKATLSELINHFKK